MTWRLRHSFIIHSPCTYFAGKSHILIVCLFTFVVTAYFVRRFAAFHAPFHKHMITSRRTTHHTARDTSVGFSTVFIAAS
jgi:hypothetical protein